MKNYVPSFEEFLNESQLNESRVDPRKVIGKPIKIGKLEIAEFDYPSEGFSSGLPWKEAKEACSELGDGWRLPTYDELEFMHKNQAKIGNFIVNLYWSSEPGDAKGEKYPKCLNMGNGEPGIKDAENNSSFRPVKDK
jgi:hypothetical protein